jgi:hypothetical protein
LFDVKMDGESKRKRGKESGEVLFDEFERNEGF